MTEENNQESLKNNAADLLSELMDDVQAKGLPYSECLDILLDQAAYLQGFLEVLGYRMEGLGMRYKVVKINAEEKMSKPVYIEDENGFLRRREDLPEIPDADARKILLNLIAGLQLCDHLGDVCSDALEAAKQAGFLKDAFLKDAGEKSFGDLEELGDYLVVKYGATTIWGTSLVDGD